MSKPLPFTAHCERGHDRVTFDGDRAGFEKHMTTEHKASRRRAGGPAYAGHGSAPGWTESGRPQGPIPWTAPKAPTTTEKLTNVLLNARDAYRKMNLRGFDPLDPEWTTDDVVPVAELAAGDVFVAAEAWGIRYSVLDTDPEKGWHLERLDDSSQAGPTRKAWVPQLRLRARPLETVIRLKRAA